MEHFSAIPGRRIQLAHRRVKDDHNDYDDDHEEEEEKKFLQRRSNSFSKELRSLHPQRKVMKTPLWICAGVLAFICVTILLPMHLLDSSFSLTSSRRHLSVLPVLPRSYASGASGYSSSSIERKIAFAAEEAERYILDFFYGDDRSLENGIPIGGVENSTKHLTERLRRKIAFCHQQHRAAAEDREEGSTTTNNGGDDDEDCTLRVVFIGSAQTSGRDVFYNDTFPFKTERRLRPLIEFSGLKLHLVNHAQDNDLGREGAQKAHMCVANLVGKAVDVIAWDLDDNMGINPSAQFEAFVRWALNSNPAMILVNRGRAGGPHGLSRRGKKKRVVEVGAGHIAEVWDDDPNDMPEQRENDYIGSDEWKNLWKEKRNSFWFEIFEKYSPFVDFAAVDPLGSIWFLDHLKAFSNGAFDTGKVLPLLDCGERNHAPPCNQIPTKFAKQMVADNVTLDSFPEEAVGGGAVCSQLFGCRHIWYGGTRSHDLRGELNALPIVRALRFAAEKQTSNEQQPLSRRTTSPLQDQEDGKQSIERALSLKALPPPTFCAEAFCNRIPTCITSHLPNLGLDLRDVIQNWYYSKEGSEKNLPMPRMGVAHFGDDPEWAVQNLEKRVVPLGYIDRKFGYRLSMRDDGNTKRLRQAAYRLDGTKPNEVVYEPEDAAEALVAFTSKGRGPVVLCEPPCFSDNCAKKRRMPLVPHISLELDKLKLEVPKIPNPPIEVSGGFCKIIANEVPEGHHVLKIKTLTTYPYHVLFSHVIAFS